LRSATPRVQHLDHGTSARTVESFGDEIGDVNNILAINEARMRRAGGRRVGFREIFGGIGLRHAVHRHGVEVLAVERGQKAELGLAQTHRLFEHGLEHRL
jgi:hypothetical protein